MARSTYRRGYRSRRRYGRRRSYKKRPNIVSQVIKKYASSVPAAAYAAYKGVNMLRGIINSELKRYDSSNSVAQGTSANINILNDIAAGDDAMNRNGNSILMKYMKFTYSIIMSSSAGETLVRVMVFVDTQYTGTAPTTTDLFGSINSMLAPINIDNTQRFTVLFDDHLALSQNGTQCVQRNHYIPLNFHAKYTGTAATTYNKNSIWLFTISNEGTNTPTIAHVCRIAFYDN